MLKKTGRFAGKSILYIILCIAAFIWMYPFVWMITASLKTNDEFWGSGLNILPQSPTLENFVRSWNNANFSQYFLNTVIVTVVSVIVVLLCTSAAGYVLGRYEFPGKKPCWEFSWRASQSLLRLRLFRFTNCCPA